MVVHRPTVELHDQVHIFGHRVEVEAASLDHRLAVKDREGPGDDERPAQQVPAGAAEMETPQVFDHLESFHATLRQAHFNHAVVLHVASVKDADDASAGHRVDGRANDGPHQAQQRVRLKQAVGVQRAEVGRAAHVDADVQSVGLPPVFFAYNQEVRDAGVQIKTAQGLGGDARAVN